MASPATPVSASSDLDRINYFRVCQVVLDHIPKVLRNVFKRELAGRKHKHSWVDGAAKSGNWLKSTEKWARRLRSEQKQMLWSGDLEKWDPTLLFYILLYSSLGLFIEEIPGASFKSKPKNRIVSPNPLPGNLVGGKVIIPIGKKSDSAQIVDITGINSPSDLKLNNKIQIFAPSNVIVYRCKAQWDAVDRLRELRNEKFAHVHAACISVSEFGQFLTDVEKAYTVLGMPPEVVRELRQIEKERIVDPDTWHERMVAAKQYEELSRKLQEQEQQLLQQGEQMGELGERTDENTELIKGMGMELRSQICEIKSDVSDIKETLAQSDERVTQYTQESDERFTKLESQLQDNSAHTKHRLEEMQVTVAETQAKVANLQAQQSNSGPPGLESPVVQIGQAGTVNVNYFYTQAIKPTTGAGSLPSPDPLPAQGRGALMSRRRTHPGQLQTPTRMLSIDTTTQGTPREQRLRPMPRLPSMPSNTSALVWLEQQPNIKPQFSFTLRSSKDGTFQHMCTIKYVKDGHDERMNSEYCLTEEEAKEQAARKLQREQESQEAIVSKSKSGTSKTPHKDELELYIEQCKFRGRVKYETRSCRDGYQSTVFVPRSGSFPGDVCRTKEQAEDNAAYHALRKLGRI